MATRRPKPRRKRVPRDLATDLLTLANDGHFAEVVTRCELHAKSQPLSAKCLHLWGFAAIQLNQFARAIEVLKQALLLADEDTLNFAIQADLAKAFFLSDDHESSVGILQNLVREYPDEIELHRNLTLVLEQLERVQEAIEVAREACSRWPSDSAFLFQLADLYLQDQQHKPAADVLKQCIEIAPDHLSARRRLVRCYRQMGDDDAVHETLQRWHEHSPDDEVVAHMLAAQSKPEQSSVTTPQRASDDYVRTVFDQFADTFETDLRSLDYRGPEQLAELIAELDQASEPWITLDAGCGTGLMEASLRRVSKRLVGVDLSAKMLAVASKRNYDELVEQELVSYLHSNPQTFDLVVSADTLNYFGDLKPVFQATHQALHGQTAAFVFSLEKHSTPMTENYRLNPNGRYSHDGQSVRSLLQECGFDPLKISEGPLRMEADQLVIGMFYLATKR